MTGLRYIWLLLFLAPGTCLFGQETDIQFSGNFPDVPFLEFVEEVEQVRIALNLNKDNFYLFGQSWGGILAMEYALKYQENLKGLIISNMVPSIPDYMEYSDTVLAPKMDPTVLAEIMTFENAEDSSTLSKRLKY